MKLYTITIWVVIWAILNAVNIGCVALGPEADIAADNVEHSITPENAPSTNLIEVLEPDSQDSVIEFQIPERQPDSARRVVEPPEVPEHLENLNPLTATIRVRVESENGPIESIRSVVRTPDRVYVNYQDQGQEWLFIRNPRDGRRVSGQLVDHREESVLFFYEQDLSNAAIVRGWADVVSMGISVEQMIPTGDTQRHYGMDFQRYVDKAPENPGGIPTMEIWWSQEQALPWKIRRTNGTGSWVQEIVELDWATDSTLLEETAGRYPQYEALDVVDWREKHRE
jgi:hypothetical protein